MNIPNLKRQVVNWVCLCIFLRTAPEQKLEDEAEERRDLRIYFFAVDSFCFLIQSHDRVFFYVDFCVLLDAG